MKKLLVALLVAAVMLGWGFGARQAQAGTIPLVDFSIGVVAEGCKTGTGDTTCDVGVGYTFTVSVFIDSYLTDDGAYGAVQARLNESAGLTYQSRAGTGEINGVWPDCGFCVEDETNLPGSYRVGGAIGIGAPESTATGVVMEVDYQCSASPSGETVTLVHGAPSDTFLSDSLGQAVDADPDEVLTINCVAGVGGIVETLTGGDSPAEGPASSSSDQTVPIAAAVAGAVLALAVGGWYARRRWLS